MMTQTQDSNKLVANKMKNETDGITIEEFVELKQWKIVEKISHSDNKDVLLNQKCLRHSMK